MPKVTGLIRSTNPGVDTYAVTSDDEKRGGWRPVANIAARNAITLDRRSLGMRVLVLSNRIEYQLDVLTVLNDQWVVVSTGGSLDFTADLELINGADTKNGSTFKSKYYEEIADSGGGEYYYAAAASDTPVPGLVIEPLDSVGRFFRIIPDKIDIRSVGGKVQVDTTDHTVGGTFDNSVVYNRTNTWCASLFATTTYNRLHTTIWLPEGNWIIHNSLIHKPRVYFEGTGCIFADGDSVGPGTTVSFANGASRILLADGCNCPLNDVDSSAGYIRQPAELLEDGTVADSKFAQIKIKGINFHGNAGNQTRFDCHGIKALYTWGITVENCSFYDVSGYQVFMRDCNVVKLLGNHMIGSGLTQYGFKSKGCLLYSNSDTQYYGNELGGFSGPGIWYSGLSAWLCLTEQNLSFNNTTNRYDISSITGDEITLVRNHSYESGMPIEIGFTFAGGAMVTGLVDSTTYWAIKTANDKLKVATSYEGALAYATRAVTSGVVTIANSSPAIFTLAAHGMVPGDDVNFTTTGGLPTGLTVGTNYVVLAPKTATVTINNSSPAAVTITSPFHGYSAGIAIRFTTAGVGANLPAGISLATTYYVLASNLTAGSYEISLTPGGAAIVTTSAGSGTHTATQYLTADQFIVAALAGPLGSVVITSSAGSGTHTAHIGNRKISGGTLAFVHHGDGSGLYLSNDANSHIVTGNRFDQNEGPGVSMSRSTGNEIEGNIIAINGHRNYPPYDGNPVPQAGVYLRNVSLDNNIQGNVFTGNALYNQGYGVYIDRFCFDNFIGYNAYSRLLTVQAVYIDPNGNTLVQEPIHNDQTGAIITSDASATPLQLKRRDTGDTQGFVITPGQLKIRNIADITTPANNGFYAATFQATSAASLLLLGTPGAASAAPRTGMIQAEGAVAASGANTPAANLLYISSNGTGIATQGGRHDFYVPTEQGQSVVTINNSSPSAATMTWPVHGFAAGQAFTVQTTGTLPAGMLPDTLYYTLASGLTADTFTFSATFGGTAIVTTTAGSGVHTATSGFSGESTAQPTTVRFRVGRQTLALPTRTNYPNILNGSDFYWNTRLNFAFYHDAINAQHTMSTPNNLGTLTINTEVPTAGTTVTFTLGTPLVVNWTAHALVANQPVSFTTSGVLPKEITTGRTYWVSATGLAANSFQISIIKGGASITGSGIQSGTQTAATYGATMTAVPTTRENTIVLDAVLTAARALTLSSTAAQIGVEWHATRSLNSSGAFDWGVDANTVSVTITVASPGVVTWTAHGLRVNDQVYFTSSGTLPGGLTSGTLYYVSVVVDANSIQVSATMGGASINTSGSAGTGHSGTARLAALKPGQWVRVGYNGIAYTLTKTGQLIGGKILTGLPLARVGGKVKEFYAGTGTPASTVETDIFPYTTFPNFFSADGDTIEFEYGGIFAGNTTGTMRIRLYFGAGGTVIFDSGNMTVAAAGSWLVSGYGIRNSSSGVRCCVSIEVPAAATGVTRVQSTDVAGLTLTNGNTIKMTGTAGVTNPQVNDLVARTGIIKWLPTST